MPELDRFLVDPSRTISDIMSGLTDTRGLALVVDSDRKLLGTVTDGDIRRAILADVDLDLPIETLLRQRRVPGRSRPFTAPVGTTESRLLQMMRDSEVRHIPLVDDDGRVVEVAVLEDLLREYELPMTAVIMAGGYGERLPTCRSSG